MARGRKNAAPETPAPEPVATLPTLPPVLPALSKTYTPAHCDAVVAFMGRGFSLLAFAGEIGVPLRRLKSWRKRHARFDEAVETGEAACRRTLEANLLSANTGAQVSAHIFALKNAAAEDCGDDQAAPPMRAELIVKFV